MKRTIPKFHLLVSVCLATIALPALRAESRCPGSAASLPFRIVNRYQIIVDVSINHSGPYEFLLDTGTQISMGKVWGGHERNEMRTNEKPFVVPRVVSRPKAAYSSKNRRPRCGPRLATLAGSGSL
jgi:hypothetical protein